MKEERENIKAEDVQYRTENLISLTQDDTFMSKQKHPEHSHVHIYILMLEITAQQRNGIVSKAF